jgi:hypothetical protein
MLVAGRINFSVAVPIQRTNLEVFRARRRSPDDGCRRPHLLLTWKAGRSKAELAFR